MTTQEIANKFYQLSQEGKWEQIQDELFSNDAESIEPPHSKGLQTVKGMKAIKKKGEDWNNMIQEVHGGYTNPPIVAGNHFSLAMGIDATLKDGNRMNVDEICLYEIKDSKIVKEQFFY